MLHASETDTAYQVGDPATGAVYLNQWLHTPAGSFATAIDAPYGDALQVTSDGG